MQQMYWQNQQVKRGAFMIDMHVHSYYSDGDISPSELIWNAKKIGLKGIALTDHDTFDGIEELLAEGKKQNFQVYSGVEISCQDKNTGRQVHILAYGLDENGRNKLKVFLQPLWESMQYAVRSSVKALENAGYPVNLDIIYKKAGPTKGIYKQMIMEQLINAGLCTTMYGALYKKLFKNGKNGELPIAHLKMEYADPCEAVEQICRAGGEAVLAHPGQYDSYELIPALVESGLAGIEIYHPVHTQNDIVRSLSIAEQYHLKCTGGSDYHGRYGEGEQLGQCGVQDYPFK